MPAVLELLTQNPHAFTNLMTCIQTGMTIPVTSASCERTFSSMKLLKNWLRNKTGDRRLSDLLTLAWQATKLLVLSRCLSLAD